ncbi:Protein K07F5.14 [Aphelenchoides avenae]|nr:Protein K07F5.14 [Aphelenchus avenae]
MSYLTNGQLTDADHNRKQAESQKRRLESLAEKRRLEQQRKELVSASLRNSGSNKRIVFDSDDDDQANGEPREANKRKQTSQLTLFDDDDEDAVKDVEGEVEEVVEARVGSKRGRKVAELQMQLGHDERFRVDDRFVEEHSTSDSESEDEVAKEKQSELDILSKVLGRSVTSSLPGSTSKKTDTAARQFLRFDPTDPEHVEWLKNYRKKTGGEAQAKPGNDSSSALKNLEEKDDEVRRVEGTFFEMKSDFAEELKERLAHPNDNGFSFLAMIGRDHSKSVCGTSFE